MGAVVKTCCECWHNVLVKLGVVKLLDKVEALVEHVVWDKVELVHCSRWAQIAFGSG